jgi:predicted lipoprotein with Yx(FWY)xxD motif
MIRLTITALSATLLLAACGGDDDQSRAESPSTAMKEEASMKSDAAMKPHKGALVKVVESRYGRVVADRTGEALYLFDREKRGRSECYGGCAKAWPPLLAKGKPRAGTGAKAKLLGTTKRRGGARQVTYRGQPLYYFKDDSPGQILCQGVDEFGGLWLVVKPSGRPVT